MTRLEEILRVKKNEVSLLKNNSTRASLERLLNSAPPPRPVAERLRKGGRGVIAEIKRASPSRGPLRESLDPALIAKEYQNAGASAISVLTDSSFFKGMPEDLRTARSAVDLPVLRKDFVLDEIQVLESRAMGADIVLLIARILSQKQLVSLQRTAISLGMAVVVEAHNDEEIRRAVDSGAHIIGLNNRDLDTFEVSLDVSLRLRDRIPESVVSVSESGILTPENARSMFSAGFDAILVGEGLVRQESPGDFLRSLTEHSHAGPVH